MRYFDTECSRTIAKRLDRLALRSVFTFCFCGDEHSSEAEQWALWVGANGSNSQQDCRQLRHSAAGMRRTILRRFYWHVLRRCKLIILFIYPGLVFRTLILSGWPTSSCFIVGDFSAQILIVTGEITDINYEKLFCEIFNRKFSEYDLIQFMRLLSPRYRRSAV